MKLSIFLFVLITLQILECDSFDFNLFGLKPKATSYSSSSVPTSPQSSDLFETEGRFENESFSFDGDEDQDYNSSISSINELLETIASVQQNEALIIINSTETILNNSKIPDKLLESIPATSETSESSSASPVFTETSTNAHQVSNRTVSIIGNVSSTTEEPEEVVLEAQPGTFTYVTKTIYQKTVDLVGDPYTLSIFVPIAAGVLFALTIILTIATCRCIKRKCRRKRFRKRVLPDSIKNLRPSDQARLLGDCCDSSDEF